MTKHVPIDYTQCQSNGICSTKFVCFSYQSNNYSQCFAYQCAIDFAKCASNSNGIRVSLR